MPCCFTVTLSVKSRKSEPEHVAVFSKRVKMKVIPVTCVPFFHKDLKVTTWPPKWLCQPAVLSRYWVMCVIRYFNISTSMTTKTGGNLRPHLSTAATTKLFSPQNNLVGLQPTESHYFIPTSHLRCKVRWNSIKHLLPHTHTHTRIFTQRKSLCHSQPLSHLHKHTHTLSLAWTCLSSFSHRFTLFY